MRTAFHNRLTLRLGAALALAIIAVLAAAGAWNLALQRSHLTRATAAGTIDRADDIRRATREAMMRNSPEEIGRILETIGHQPSVERIRLIDARGLVRRSSDTTEIGRAVDRSAEQCTACHRGAETVAAPRDEDRAHLATTPDGRRVLAVISPIRNETSCSAAPCHVHPTSQRVLGMLELQVSLDELEASLAASGRQMLLASAGALTALLALVWWLIWHMVLRPVGRLTTAAQRVAAGELGTHIQVGSDDEIGEMTEAWNTMIAKLGRAQILLERWSKSLEENVERKTAELEAAHRRMLVVEKMASLGRMSAVVAHEINNPLAGIGTYARLLRRRRAELDGPADRGEADDTERILRLIEEEAERCGEIVRNLLLVSRAGPESFAPLELRPLIERCAMLLRHQAERRDVALEVDVADDLPEMLGAASQIQQMVLALGQNALEATLDGGEVVLEVRHDEGERAIVLRVRDTGRGIAAEDLGSIYEPFFTTKPEGSGVGLGLAVVYGIVERHHGRIDVDSRPGEGSVFTVTLPLRPPAPNDEESEAPNR